jgi:hypothetical protein
MELRNAPDRFICDGRALSFVDVDKLSSDVGHAGDFVHAA